MKKVLILSASLRNNSNSDQLAKAFAEGASSAGNQVEYVSLKGKDLQFCKGCLACQKQKRCVIHDDADALMETVRNADVLVFATPIYYYAMSGQLKTFLDRMNPIFAAGHRYQTVYLLATAAENAASAMDGAVKEMQGWIDCFDGVSLANVLRATGVNDAGEIAEHEEYLAQARQLGAGIR